MLLPTHHPDTFQVLSLDHQKITSDLVLSPFNILVIFPLMKDYTSNPLKSGIRRKNKTKHLNSFCVV